MSEQPQEWTAATINTQVGFDADRQCEREIIARFHNAALAAAKGHKGGKMSEQSQELTRLATEWAADDRKWNTEEVVKANLIAFANAALAAMTTAYDAYDKGYEDCRKLWKQQLAAECGKYPTHCPNCGWPGTTEASRQ